MRISSNETFMGIPILEIRSLLRHTAGGEWKEHTLVETISRLLDLSTSESTNLLEGLLLEGYMENVESNGGDVLLENTIKGNALSIASAAKPISRKTADKKMAELLDRVKQVNADEYYLYKVKKVVVFGSYLSSREKLSDIDIAVELVAKENDTDKHFELEKKRVKEAISLGRSFNTYLDELFWPKVELLRFLKSRSRSISLHDIADKILEQTEWKIVFEEGEQTP